MSFLNYQSYLKVFLKNYASCSLVNAEGSLLYSKDAHFELLTTTRLVAFQIIKKYLNPKPHDFFVLNDPENGGYQYTKLLFISCLMPNLFLVWNEDNFYVDFKIPPTPLFENGVRNDFIWQTLISANKYTAELDSFFSRQKLNIDNILKHKTHLNIVADIKNQQTWLAATQEVFAIQFANKAHGGFACYHNVSPNQLIKLKFTAEEKQNLRLITLDFTNTNIATEMHTASHVIESALIKKIIDFYQINDFFTQSILDKIKVILPPRSIVSKSHPTGSYNFELQTICSQMCEHNMRQLNSHMRKPHAIFEYANFLYFEIHTAIGHSYNIFSPQSIFLNNFEELIANNAIKMKKMKRTDKISHIIFQSNTDSTMKINIKNNYYSEKSNNLFKVNDQLLQRGQHDIKKNDLVELIWSPS